MKLSVLVPAYNVQDTLEQCVRSALDETGVDLEVVVVDDCSTDGTPRVMERLAAEDPRVRAVYRTANGGDGAARNSGLDVLAGDWIVPVDGDDYLVPGGLRAIYDAALASQADILEYRLVYHDVTIDATWVDQGAFDSAAPREPFCPRDYPDISFAALGPGPVNKTFRTSFVRREGLRFQELPRVGDVEFVLTAVAVASSVELVDIEPYVYRAFNPQSLTGNGDRAPRAFYDACVGLHDALVRRGLWGHYRTGFLVWLVENIPFNLDLMRTYEGFKTLAEAFKDEGFARFEFDRLTRGQACHADAYDYCARLRDLGVNEFLHERFFTEHMKARHLGGDVTWRDGEIARLNAQVVRLDEQVARLRNERDAVRSALACVEDSASFKVGRALTAPPRALRDLLHPTAWSDRGADEYNSANEDRHV